MLILKFLILFIFVPSLFSPLLKIARLFSISNIFFKEPVFGFLIQFFDLLWFYLLPFSFWIILLFFFKFLSWMSRKLSSSLSPQLEAFTTINFLPISILLQSTNFDSYFHYNLAINSFIFPL